MLSQKVIEPLWPASVCRTTSGIGRHRVDLAIEIKRRKKWKNDPTPASEFRPAEIRPEAPQSWTIQ